MKLKHTRLSGLLRRALFATSASIALFFGPWLATVHAATFGTVVSIGGHASDVALDEPRGLLYIANFTANRVDIMSLADNKLKGSFQVSQQPSSLSVSPNGNYLVIAHYGNFASGAQANSLTAIALNAGNTKQTYALTDPPLGVVFGGDNLAFVVTTKEFLLFDPTSGQFTLLDTISNVTANTLPVPPPKFPPQIIAASLNISKNGFDVYGLTDTIRFHYDVLNQQVQSLGYSASPPLGPRVVSVSGDGSYYTAGWGLFGASGILIAQFADPAGTLNVGSHAINSSAGLIYAQIPDGTAQSQAAPPIVPTTPPAPQGSIVAPSSLTIVDADNLALREKLQLSENLAGKSVLNAKGNILYAISDSGVTVLPVGFLREWHRVTGGQPDVVFRGEFCNRAAATQQMTIVDPGGGQTDFTLSPDTAGISVSPTSGTTPAVVTVTVDTEAFANQNGTYTGWINIQSTAGVNIPNPVRVLINNREPEQRGTFVAVPGKLVDIAADPARRRFYVLRQDQNQVLVYDSTNNKQIGTLRTSNTPTSMAITFDRKYLIVGHENSQLAYVYNLDTLKRDSPIVFPGGHYPRSIAVSSRAILAASRVAGSTHTIDMIDFASRTASTPATLGIFQNSINIDTALASSPNGSSILAASADGTLLLYDAAADTFVAARKDFPALSGAYAASNSGQYLVDNNLLNSSLVVVKKLDATSGTSSGFAFVDQSGFRATAASPQSPPGVIQRVTMSSGNGIKPTRIVEAPLTFNTTSAFTRTLAPLSDRSGIVALSTSGFTLLPWNYDAATAPPVLSKVVNAADLTQPVALGGLISVFGSQLSAVSQATGDVPVPTVLADSCLTINGNPIPMTLVSPTQINAQLPFSIDGDASMVLHAPGGVSSSMNVSVLPTAPSVFRSGTAGPLTGIPTVVRAKNSQLVTLANPIHGSDVLIIYATGLGAVTPEVKEGEAGPTTPLALTSITPLVTLGNTALSVQFSGLAPGLVGVYQINVSVPFKVTTGFNVPLTIDQGGAKTTLSVRVVK